MGIEINYNGNLTLTGAKHSIMEDFYKEAELCDYIEQNILAFCRDVLGSEYIRHKREFKLYQGRPIKGSSGLRIDFRIETNNGFFYIECKCPSQESQVHSGISQCLAYHMVLKDSGQQFNKIVLLSAKLSEVAVNIILEFNLPIDFVYFSRDKYARLIQNGH